MRPLVPMLVLLFGAALSAQENWPQFRGDQAHGIADGAPVATVFSVPDKKQIAWRTPIDGLAHSSPVIWGDRIFVVGVSRKKGKSELKSLYGSKGYGAGESVADEGEQSFFLYALNKHTGKILSRSLAHKGVPKVKRHPKASHANATPACDATRVVVCLGSEGLFCFAHDGRMRWKVDLGTLNVGAPGYKDKAGYQWGHASSPVLAGDKVFVQCDHEGQSFLAAYDADSGRQLWRVKREEDSTWCTPTFHATAAGENGQLILNGYKHIGGYDPVTGAMIWKLAGGGDVPVPTPVVVNGLIFLTSAHGRSRPLRAIRVEAKGDLTEDENAKAFIAWNNKRRGVYMQTPLIYKGLVYACSDGGIVGVYDAKTGARIYRKRLGDGSTGFSGSAVAANDKIYFTGESGTVFVVKAGAEFELLAQNELGENCMSTPAISAGRIYFRAKGHLVAIAKPAGKTAEKPAAEKKQAK